MYSFLSLPFATGAYWELLALTAADGCNPLIYKGKSHFFEELSEGGGKSGVKMVCLPISPLPHAGRSVVKSIAKRRRAGRGLVAAGSEPASDPRKSREGQSAGTRAKERRPLAVLRCTSSVIPRAAAAIIAAKRKMGA